jgi:hypothetical protein
MFRWDLGAISMDPVFNDVRDLQPFGPLRDRKESWHLTSEKVEICVLARTRRTSERQMKNSMSAPMVGEYGKESTGYYNGYSTIKLAKER